MPKKKQQRKTYFNYLCDISRKIEKYCKGEIELHEHGGNLFIDIKLNRKIVYRHVIYSIFNKWVWNDSTTEIANEVVCNYFDYIFSQHFKKDFLDK